MERGAGAGTRRMRLDFERWILAANPVNTRFTFAPRPLAVAGGLFPGHRFPSGTIVSISNFQSQHHSPGKRFANRIKGLT